MFFYLISFLAGILTVLAPCVLPVLPVIIGGSLSEKSYRRPLVITLSLGASIILFTLLLKVSTAFISVPPVIWKAISGGIILIFGLTLLYPNTWNTISAKLKLSGSSEGALHSATKKKGVTGEILIGAALGPVFASCSPTYFIILATILPLSLTQGIINLIFYAAGLVLILFAVAILGQKLIAKMKWAANPNGWFKKSLGILMIVVGLAILSGYDKKAEIWLLENNINPGGVLEQQILDALEKDSPLTRGDVPLSGTEGSGGGTKYSLAPDFIGLENWINSEPIDSLKNLKGKVVLIDFWTYSCINCVRTLPFLQAWHEKYEDEGLIVIGIHAPEFQFEKILKNVKAATKEHELTYPIVQDNDFKTWRAYKNRYWPAKYLIDKDGYIRYTHFGEGAYEQTEMKIIELLYEESPLTRGDVALRAKEGSKLVASNITPDKGSKGQSPEIYFGAWRNSQIANGTPELLEKKEFMQPETTLEANAYYLDGIWDIKEKYMQNEKTRESITFNFSAKKIFTVARADAPVRVKVSVDGKEIQTLTIQEDKIYTLFESTEFTSGLLKLEILNPKLQLFTLTFG
jgi:cytochrome c biogenesis protein CcdA/thiol-disulfide isomerase/thioredoxin